MVKKAIESWMAGDSKYQSDEEIIEAIYRPHDFTEMAGYSEFSLDKFLHMILYFTRRGVQKTKLMKLLWYSDFLYFKRQSVSISGATYCRRKFGPVPKDHDMTLAHLQHMNIIEVDETLYDDRITMTVIAKEPFDSTLFTEDEI
ncbi:Panacea domain-containing protein [Paenibacillus eucommiae]|uniref:Antitoxin SocA-like Panacea domain-containing protein n=1 Tax=Paenibacillus eucommiae TaxID=1355755 RepID=A0ABS4ISN4_9BACL|nr:Panacea domain-containing protein [Paenibacillus eucommiae]MBP1990578.1 hypothetical protein [Paenibacillus eucommiae]